MIKTINRKLNKDLTMKLRTPQLASSKHSKSNELHFYTQITVTTSSYITDTYINLFHSKSTGDFICNYAEVVGRITLCNNTLLQLLETTDKLISF